MVIDGWLTIGCHLAIPPRPLWLRPRQHIAALRSLPPPRLTTMPTTPCPRRPTARWSSGWRPGRRGRRCSRWRWFPGRARSHREGRSDVRCFFLYAKYAHCLVFFLQLYYLFCLFAFFLHRRRRCVAPHSCSTVSDHTHQLKLSCLHSLHFLSCVYWFCSKQVVKFTLMELPAPDNLT